MHFAPASRTPPGSPQKILLHLGAMVRLLHSLSFLSQANYKPLGLSQVALASALLF